MDVNNEQESIDICFILDATGSMASAIEAVKTHIREIVKGIQDVHTGCAVRVAIAAYRDYLGDESKKREEGEDSGAEEAAGCLKESETLEFTSDLEAFTAFLGRLRACGGADEAEDVFTGIEIAAGLQWTADSRLVVHVADAPCHGKQYHGDLRVGDNYPAGDKYGRTAVALLSRLRDACGVASYKFIHLDRSTKPMIVRFREELEGAESWFSEEHLETPSLFQRGLSHTVIDASISSISITRMMRSTMRDDSAFCA